MYTIALIVCPDVLSTVVETSEGLCVGFIKSDEVLFVLLFICI